MVLHAIIFLSGGAILALELLASRIMTPYFGVSLYIWTGILSITLVSLALGYWLGGRMANGLNDRPAGALVKAFVLMPALAALAIVTACLAYPFWFAALANWSLLGGAFVACLILLLLPLVATSAMNPLLVAIVLRQPGARAADAGAGRVFFISTVGSVAGVLVTAFGLIPLFSNFTAVLLVAMALAMLTLLAALFPPQPFPSRSALSATALIAAACAGTLLWQADAYTGMNERMSYGGTGWKLEARYASLFGTVKIMRSDPEPSGRFVRMYFQDGLTQNAVDSAGRSTSFYTYALEALARSHQPGLRSALVLGLGAGMVPMQLARLNIEVEAVDIDPVSVRAARTYFGFDDQRVRTHITDARTFLRRCPHTYDVVIVDLFHGDGTPDYLVTRDFFRDLKNCLGEKGIAVFNTFADLEQPAAYAHLLVTLQSELPHLVLYRPDLPGVTQVNSFIVAGATALTPPAKVTMDYVPGQHQANLWAMLARPLATTGSLTAGGRILTDARNAATHDMARAQLDYRRSVVANMPRGFLLN